MSRCSMWMRWMNKGMEEVGVVLGWSVVLVADCTV